MATEDQCTACGERNPAGSAFCVFCGTYLGWDEASSAAEAPPEPVVPTGPPATSVATGSALGGPPPAAPPPAPTPPPSAVAPPPPVGTPCPSCGQDNPVTRRFCSRCGQQLTAATAIPPREPSPPDERRSWWRSEDRTARRDYRRSLPGFYRWRRIILGLLAVALVVLVASTVGRDPVGWAKDRWYDLRGTTEPVPDVTAVAGQPGGGRPKPAEGVVDTDPATAWQRTWVHGTDPASSCAEAERDGFVDLTWDSPVRVTALQMDAGLAEDAAGRDLEYRPETVFVGYRTDPSSKRECWRFEIPDTGERRTLELDTEDEVDRLRVSIGSVFDSVVPDEDGKVSIRRIIVLSRPQ